MNPLIELKTTPPLLIILTLLCFGLLPRAQAVNPPPDGGYGPPAYGTGNTAEGERALFNLSSGGFNTATGFRTLSSVTTGNSNTAIGAGALFNNTGDQNTATGAGALFSNTAGDFNTANGVNALRSNTTGLDNTAIGSDALFHNTIGHSNTAVGPEALFSNTTGMGNTGYGSIALRDNTTGDNNTAIGRGTLLNNMTGGNNVAVGHSSGGNVTTASNVICIGGVEGQNVSNSCFIGSIFGQTSLAGTAVFIDPAGKLGTSTSSRRFKQEIRPMERASEALFALKPVTFRYKKEIDPAGTSQLGLVAEDVEKVNPDLLVRDKEGKPYSVRYDQVNAMLLNEFLKEHREVAELKSTVAEQRKGMEAMAAQLKEQAAQIQKVSGQLEASKPAPQVVNNP